MTKIRSPGSVKAAGERSIKILGGYERAAEMLGKSPRLLAYWTDPDDDRDISARAIYRLDTATRELGQGTPISDALSAECCRGINGRAGANPYRDLADLQACLGAYAADLNRAMADGRLDPQDRRTAVGDLFALRDEVDKAIQALEPPPCPEPARMAAGRKWLR